MLRRRALLLVLAFVGLLKAAAVVWVGAQLELPTWVVTTSAALWAIGPALAGWFVSDRAWARRFFGGRSRATYDASPRSP